jgi:hypothetical protein
MAKVLTLEKYALGVGDRFADQAKGHLRACLMAGEQGVKVIPGWNNSSREHMTICSELPITHWAADPRPAAT